MKLTAKTVAALGLPAGKTDHFAWDDELAGFGHRLRVAAGGKVRRSWIVQYRRGGATRRILLGAGEVLGAEAARTAARKVLAQVALGADPQADRRGRRDRDRITLRATVADYLAIKAKEVRPGTLYELRRYLAGPHFQPLHGMPIDQVGRKDVASRLISITREHGSVTAARARAALSAFYVWALGEGLAEANPVIGTNKPADSKPRERTLTDAELAAIWNACGDDHYGRVVRLLILTGCRRQEVGGICWGEIDLDAGTWTIPGERTKNHRPHTLPLMPAALEIVRAVPRMASRDQLFGVRGKGFSRWGMSKDALDERSGVAGWVVHDIRRSVATRMADLGIAPHIVEAVLNHQSGHRAGVAGIYNRSRYEREVRSALALWADHVRALAEGGGRKIHSLPRAVR
jgi:integrase